MAWRVFSLSRLLLMQAPPLLNIISPHFFVEPGTRYPQEPGNYNVFDSLTLDIATDTILNLKKNRKVKLDKSAFIHSDQGFHYTSPIFQKLVKSNGLSQSMSRRGNCWDNAPQESFFGHFKDEAYIKSCQTLEELKREIQQYMIYYNNYRYQWNLKKMTPVQFRNHLLNIA